MPKYKLTAEPGGTMKNKTGSWRTFYPVVDHEKCISCGTCAKVCPEGVCYKDKDGKYDNDLDYCKGCGLCAEECPVKCIKMKYEEK
ncbi:MAG: 4Fe-4S dicluster domain-containing protein [Patescibacteria group bacterium]